MPPLLYMNFRLLRLEGAFHRLLPNEKVVAKQELLSAFDAVERTLSIEAYAVTGLGDCDLLLWRLSPSLEELHEASCRLHRSGMGKYLAGVRSYLGTVPADRYKPLSGKPPVLAQAPYLSLRVLPPSAGPALETLQGFPAERLHVADLTGFGADGWLAAFEAQDPLEHRRLARALPQASEAHFALHREVRDLVDNLG